VIVVKPPKELAAAVCFEAEGPSLDWAGGAALIREDRLAVIAACAVLLGQRSGVDRVTPGQLNAWLLDGLKLDELDACRRCEDCEVA